MLVKGVDVVVGNLSAASAVLVDTYVQANHGKLEKTGNNAANRAPKQTGELRGSKTVTSQRTGDGLNGEVRFTAPHSLAVHERTWIPHAVGEAKFLENAMKEELATWNEDVTAAVRKALAARLK